MSERLSVADLRARLGGGTATATVEAAALPTPPVRPGFRRGVQAAEAAAPVESPRQASLKYRSNRYAGTCADCGQRVEAEAGTLEKGPSGWITRHLPTACPAPSATSSDPVEAAVAATEQEVPPGFVKITAVTGQTYVGLQPGIYTLETAKGHRTFRVRVQSTDEDFAPGKTILEYLSGPDNERDYTGFAFLNGTRLQTWKRFREGAEDLLADAQAFLADPSQALLSARCIRCNARLTTPTSVATMMGDTCRSKGW